MKNDDDVNVDISDIPGQIHQEPIPFDTKRGPTRTDRDTVKSVMSIPAEKDPERFEHLGDMSSSPGLMKFAIDNAL